MNRRTIIVLGIISAFSILTYLLVSYFYYRVGFPLDDAWIHQTYARNLALRSEWAFNPGETSSGSTGPLWPGLLAIGYILKINPYAWTYFLGWLSLWGIAVLGSLVFSKLTLLDEKYAVWVGIILSFEWHLVWAAVSGMETILFTLLIISVLGAIVHLEHQIKPNNNKSWFGLGILIGISVWLRPDGVTLLGPALVAAFIISETASKKIRVAIISLFGFMLIFLPYLIFNRVINGMWWPNTFYAKQAEYAILQSIPIWKRFFQLGVLPLIGVGVVLLPGLILFLKKSINEKRWSPILGSLWFLGYLGLYVWRLPVTYQHGRYLIPMMPALFIWCIAGFSEYLIYSSNNFVQRVTIKSGKIIVIVVLLVFWCKGSVAYAQDVAVIESEMVDIALWVNQQLAPDVIIAAHDIGALGYFSKHHILDLAGLISPDVIPFIRNEAALQEFLNTKNAKYLITFPSWYPELIDSATIIFQTPGTYSIQFGGEKMAVYLRALP